MDADQIRSLQPAMAAYLARFAEYFNRKATFGHFQRYVLGLLTDLSRKSIEPIALAAGTPVRTMQEFLAFFKWNHDRVREELQRYVADVHGGEGGIGVIDASGHRKRGDKTPGVQRQYCGEVGKIDNCVVGQHLLYTDNDPANPFSCMLASDLYLPKSWVEDRASGGTRCHEAGIPDELTCRPKWNIAIDQVKQAAGNGVRFAWLTFDEDYGNVPAFWYALDDLGQRGIGEVRRSFGAWTSKPSCRSLRCEHGPKRVENLVRQSPVFTQQAWRTMTIKDSTRGPIEWEIKAARVHLVTYDQKNVAIPTDRQYWLIVARDLHTGEIKYFVSNAAENASLEEMLRAGFARWHVEKWFERAKQECGLGAFEVRTYTSLIRHWLCSTLAMLFLAEQTTRLREKKSADHLRAGGPGRQHAGIEILEPPLALVR